MSSFNPRPPPAPPPNAGLTTPFSRLTAHPSADSSSSGHATPSTGLRLDTDPESSPRSAAAAHAESSSFNIQQPAEDIEMELITPGGHRRRRSSLMNPPNGAHSGRTTRARGQSLLAPSSLQDDSNIVEEDGEPGGRAQDQADDSLSDEDLHEDEETGLTGNDRRRKQKKKRRNTQLDNRIVRDKITPEEQKEADQSVARKSLVNVTLILLWYLFSLCISLYNKWMFADDKLNFPFPMFTTSIHMLVQFALASLVLFFVPSLRPHSSHISNLGQSRHELEPERPAMTKMFYLTRIGPCGVATGLDIGLGNTSLEFITLTFYTMCKSSSLAFVLIFAFLFRLETPTWRLVAIIATMTLGVVMMVAGEVEFKLGGFILVISAAFFSGFRWGLTQILLLRNPATSNPFSSIFFLAPVMFTTLACIAIPVEGFWELLAGLKTLTNEWGPVMTPLLILFPGTIAFLMTASEFALLQRTSVVTLSIAGIFKEVVTISTAMVVFDDKLTTVNISGLFVTIGAICAYNYIKITKMRQEARDDVQRGRLQARAVSSASNSGSDGENEADGEEAGLLRTSTDLDESLITADGDIIPKPVSSPAGDARNDHRSE